MLGSRGEQCFGSQRVLSQGPEIPFFRQFCAKVLMLSWTVPAQQCVRSPQSRPVRLGWGSRLGVEQISFSEGIPDPLVPNLTVHCSSQRAYKPQKAEAKNVTMYRGRPARVGQGAARVMPMYRRVWEP